MAYRERTNLVWSSYWRKLSISTHRVWVDGLGAASGCLVVGCPNGWASPGCPQAGPRRPSTCWLPQGHAKPWTGGGFNPVSVVLGQALPGPSLSGQAREGAEFKTAIAAAGCPLDGQDCVKCGMGGRACSLLPCVLRVARNSASGCHLTTTTAYFFVKREKEFWKELNMMNHCTTNC